MPLLPDWILNNILDNLVLPRLQVSPDFFSSGRGLNCIHLIDRGGQVGPHD